MPFLPQARCDTIGGEKYEQYGDNSVISSRIFIIHDGGW